MGCKQSQYQYANGQIQGGGSKKIKKTSCAANAAGSSLLSRVSAATLAPLFSYETTSFGLVRHDTNQFSTILQLAARSPADSTLLCDRQVERPRLPRRSIGGPLSLRIIPAQASVTTRQSDRTQNNFALNPRPHGRGQGEGQKNREVILRAILRCAAPCRYPSFPRRREPKPVQRYSSHVNGM